MRYEDVCSLDQDGSSGRRHHGSRPQTQEKARQENEWIQAVKDRCPEIKWISHYALLGQWDFMDIYEAPDEETAAIVSLLSRDPGAYLVESWSAIPNHRLEDIANAIAPPAIDPD